MLVSACAAMLAKNRLAWNSERALLTTSSANGVLTGCVAKAHMNCYIAELLRVSYVAGRKARR